jgi:hypothetical protein
MVCLVRHVRRRPLLTIRTTSESQTASILSVGVEMGQGINRCKFGEILNVSRVLFFLNQRHWNVVVFCRPTIHTVVDSDTEIVSALDREYRYVSRSPVEVVGVAPACSQWTTMVFSRRKVGRHLFSVWTVE